MSFRSAGRIKSLCWTAALAFVIIGCAPTVSLIPPDQRKSIDRAVIERPSGLAIAPFIRGLTSPSAIAEVTEDGGYKGATLVADNGIRGQRVHIFGFKADGTYFDVYPFGKTLPFDVPFVSHADDIYGPVGGMLVHGGKIYISHRAADDSGVITALGFDGSRRTVVAGLPAEGDYGVTDLALVPERGRLYFGVGSATNSGLVGVDNFDVGWVRDHPNFCDVFNEKLKLYPMQFDTANPRAGLFGGPEKAVTGGLQPFNASRKMTIPGSPIGKPTSAIYSISPEGGDLQVEATGIRLPKGLAAGDFGGIFFTNQGMEMRGTRPIKDDPDSLLKLFDKQWYGFPDFTTNLYPATDPKFRPPSEIMSRGWPEISFLIDHAGSILTPPTDHRDLLLYNSFPALSGAEKLAFVPNTGPFESYKGSVIIAMSGDRAPFATSGQKLAMIPGRKLLRVVIDPDSQKRTSSDFIFNTKGIPASEMTDGAEALERPVDVKFGADGRMYILDRGIMTMKGGRESIVPGTGRVFIVESVSPPPTSR